MLLMDRPIQFMPVLASTYSVEEAIVLQFMHTTSCDLRDLRGHDSDPSEYLDLQWSNEKWLKKLPFFSFGTLFDTLTALLEKDLIRAYEPDGEDVPIYNINYDRFVQHSGYLKPREQKS